MPTVINVMQGLPEKFLVSWCLPAEVSHEGGS